MRDPPLGPPSTLAEIFRRTYLQSNLQNFRKKPKNRTQGGVGGVNFFLPEFFFVLVRSPCKISQPYDNPFWGFNNGSKKKKSTVILPEEHGYIVGRARLYCRKSTVILFEDRGYIPGRVRLYFCTENSGLPKFLRWSHALRSDQNFTPTPRFLYFF
jgi:hypothetical protein